MIDFHNVFYKVFINFLTVKTQNTLMKFIFPAEPSNINKWASFQRLKQPLGKSNKGLNSVSYSGPSLWNKLPIEIKSKNKVSKLSF